jgi:hypothetical protein
VKQSTTSWYICPADAHTNEMVTTTLEGLHNQEKYSSLVCDDGKFRDLIKVPDHAFVSRLEKSKAQLYITFTIFCADKEGAPRLWKFEKKKKPTLKKLIAKGTVKAADTLLPKKKKTSKSALRF